MRLPILLVNNTNLHPISHSFHVNVDYWSNFAFDGGGGLLFNRLIRSEPMNLQLRNLKWL